MITRSIFIILIVLCEFESGFSGVRLKGIDFQVHSILPVVSTYILLYHFNIRHTRRHQPFRFYFCDKKKKKKIR